MPANGYHNILNKAHLELREVLPAETIIVFKYAFERLSSFSCCFQCSIQYMGCPGRMESRSWWESLASLRTVMIFAFVVPVQTRSEAPTATNAGKATSSAAWELPASCSWGKQHAADFPRSRTALSRALRQ